MIIDEIVRGRLSDIMGIPTPELTDELARKIIIDKPVNLIYLKTETGTKTFPSDTPNDTNSRKLARVLNLILLDHFEDIESFLAVLGIDLIFINDIWYSEVRNPKAKVIKELIVRWNIDPLYLYGLKDKYVGEETMLIPQKQETV